MAKAIVVKNKILTQFEAHFSAYHPCLKIETTDQDHFALNLRFVAMITGQLNN